MSQPRPIGEIIAEIMADIKELQDRYEKDCSNEILSCKAAAAYIGRTPSTVSLYIAQGKLHKVSDGVTVGIAKSELKKFRKSPSSS